MNVVKVIIYVLKKTTNSMNIVIIDVKIKESQYYFNPQVSIQAKITIK